MKIILLLPIALLCFGAGFNYDVPGSVGSGRGATLQARLGLSHTEIQSLYSIYSYSNVPFSLLCGSILQKYLKVGTAAFSILSVLGTALFAVAAWREQLWVCIFLKKRMAFAVGVSQAVQRGAVSLNFLVMPRLATHFGDVAPALALGGCGSTFVTMIAALFLSILSGRCEDDEDFTPSQPQQQQQQPSLQQQQEKPALFKRCSDLGLTYFILMVQAISVYMIALPILGVGRLFFEVASVYRLDAADAGAALSLYQLLVAIGQPSFGFLFDMTGRLAFWNLSAAFVLVAGVQLALHYSAIENAEPQIIIVVLLALAFSATVQSVRPAIPKLVPPSSLGLGMGAMASFVAGSTATVRLIFGKILDDHVPAANNTLNVTNTFDGSAAQLPSRDAFTIIFTVFFAFSVCAVFFSLLLVVVGRKSHVLVGKDFCQTQSESGESFPLVLPSRPPATVETMQDDGDNEERDGQAAVAYEAISSLAASDLG